jgi:CheY-like chemotaxis protein
VSLGRRTVVVADDDAEIRHTIGEYLAAHGYVVHEAANGLEALTLVKDTAPAFVVLDVVMPRLGGLDALKRIKASDPEIRVIVITGRADEFREPALARGALQVLEKPVDVAVLLRALGGPVAESPGSQQGRPPLAAPQSPAAKRRARVLVVDDDPRVCEVLTELVAAEGYLASSATDGKAAIRVILDSPPDVVLLDIAMPGLNGIDALRTIRTVAPDVQVIMVSGAGEGEASRVALAYGAFDFISKPVNLPYLAASLEMALVMTHVIP